VSLPTLPAVARRRRGVQARPRRPQRASTSCTLKATRMARPHRRAATIRRRVLIRGGQATDPGRTAPSPGPRPRPRSAAPAPGPPGPATVCGRMTDLASYRRRLQSRLAELAAELRVPGAACGVLERGETVVVTTGVANVATRAPVTPDTLFQIGSITKIYTTTLVMQAVAAGVVSLDDSVRSQLQEFTVADPAATIEITPRHLLAHTSGLEGDHLLDTGWNEDALAAYVSTLAGLGQIHPTAAAYSFCNTGYGVLGRLLEVATGEHFDRVLRRRLTRPLGCRATVTLPQHALLHAVAVGHVQEPGGEPVRQSRWSLTRSNGPM